MTFELTDPAYEIGDLAQWLIGLPAATSPTLKILSLALDLPDGSYEYLELMAAARLRLKRLGDLAQTMLGGGISADRCNEVKQAADNLAFVFHPASQTTQWASVLGSHVTTKDGFAFAMFSPHAQRVRPLRLLGDGERPLLLMKIEEAIEQLEKDEDFFGRSEIIASMERLKLVLTYFRFFGHEMAISDLASAVAKVKVASEKDTSTIKRVGLTVTALVAAMELMLLPANAIQGIQTYNDFYLHQAKPLLLGFHEKFLIEGPEAHRKRAGAEVSDASGG